ncbi:UNVERIFIED_CONTAM: hypothetical protein Sradi_5723000 [Sesamum radiatum]|uniref:Chromo domain-containing protein n=1 Tax=Sesamum radiatum TaxID=300843 RepID=A0AAW2L4A0_SESRA
MGVSSIRNPVQILGQRAGSATSPPQVLVQWEGQEETDASWVSLSDFCVARPEFDLEDKVQLEGKGNDTVQTAQAPIINPIDNSNGPEEEGLLDPVPRRSTRVKQQPKYLLDYY